jgi:hypothetical protein
MRRMGPLGTQFSIQFGCPLLDHGVELLVVNEGQGDVEDLPRLRGDGGEEAVEEYRV